MNREYHKWYSQALGRDMEFLIYGHAGAPLLVFPTSMGRFYQFEDFGMITTFSQRIESGQYQVFCVDSVDTESWYNKGVHPSQRARRHSQYDHYLASEFVPYIRSRNHASQLTATGCSFGGYHCMNFALRHPDQVSSAVSMGGGFDMDQFVDSYHDDDVYFNSPFQFIPNMSDPWYLDRIRGQRLVLATGEVDICLADNQRLSAVMTAKGIPHWLDVWGNGTGHDWPWWKQMLLKYF
jgi:esterase/lipase superfamily enzyme